jgi:hypothetical protein
MTMKFSMVEEFSFSTEDNVATACSNALRKVRSLADAAPIGRLFASISTLSETSSHVNQSLNAGDLAAAAKLMKKYATPVMADSEPLPMHFKRRG